jgi:hypothetical protein
MYEDTRFELQALSNCVGYDLSQQELAVKNRKRELNQKLTKKLQKITNLPSFALNESVAMLAAIKVCGAFQSKYGPSLIKSEILEKYFGHIVLEALKIVIIRELYRGKIPTTALNIYKVRCLARMLPTFVDQLALMQDNVREEIARFLTLTLSQNTVRLVDDAVEIQKVLRIFAFRLLHRNTIKKLRDVSGITPWLQHPAGIFVCQDFEVNEEGNIIWKRLFTLGVKLDPDEVELISKDCDLEKSLSAREELKVLYKLIGNPCETKNYPSEVENSSLLDATLLYHDYYKLDETLKLCNVTDYPEIHPYDQLMEYQNRNYTKSGLFALLSSFAWWFTHKKNH